MNSSYGYLEGVITKIEDHGHGHKTFEVLAPNGVTCYVTDIEGLSRPFPIEVGMDIVLEDASVMFENGRIQYCVDEQLRGVQIGEEATEYRRIV